MVRISDILKRAKEKEAREREAREKEQEKERLQSLKKEISPQPEEQKEKKAKAPGVRISPIVMKGAKAASDEASLELYEEILSFLRKTLKENVIYESIDAKRISAQIGKIVDQLSLANGKMLMLALTKDSKDENYLLCHSINVCIFSIEIGLGLGYEKPKLMELGVSTLFHDMGMPKHLRLVNQPRKLSAGEYNEVKGHPLKGAEILKKVKHLDEIAVDVAHQHHERIDGSGYPHDLKEESINEYARIAGLVDAYEAMTHRRAYRDEFSAFEAVREILSNKKAFTSKLIKILIERMGIFPVGSVVELGTKEIAEVARLNHVIPLRPVVRIIYEAGGKEPQEEKILDLAAHPTIHIKKGLRKSELKTPPSEGGEEKR